MGIFERYLSIWVGLCIIAGVTFGNLFPQVFQLVAKFEYAHVNLAIAVLIWIMIYPMMVQVDFTSIKDVRSSVTGFAILLVLQATTLPFLIVMIVPLLFIVAFPLVQILQVPVQMQQLL